MELKSMIALEFEKGGRTYRMELPNEAPLGEAYEAASNFMVKISDLIKDHANSLVPREPEAIEDVVVEEE